MQFFSASAARSAGPGFVPPRPRTGPRGARETDVEDGIEARGFAALTREQIAQRLGRMQDPRCACFAFGLRNARRFEALGRRGDPALAALLAKAAPQDCLDAAFSLQVDPPEDAAGVAFGGAPPHPPFLNTAYYEAIARWLGCRFDSGQAVRRARELSDARLTPGQGRLSLRVERDGDELYLWTPEAETLPAFASLVEQTPKAARKVVIVPPEAFGAVDEAYGPRVETGRLDPLHAVPSAALADRVTTPAQAAALAVVGTVSVLTLFVAPVAAFLALVVMLTAVLFGYAASRGLAIWADPHAAPPRTRLTDAALPAYSILVPLYNEHGSALGDLVGALKRLDYPPDKIDIQFLVEADDAATRTGLEIHARTLRCRITVVPAGTPRTKPRALNVGLRQARGALVTIFDAEDRPEPQQLRTAAETFAAAPPQLAALQARLHVDHAADCWLTRMFAIEYACQFNHILPMVTAQGGLILLGGTSNHFRADVLARVGGWDPFNVTEDADLAVRLRRFGYTVAVIDSETSEEAPLTVAAWLKQRSRWFKGFMQTWLVHNRRPLALVRDIGWRDALLFHLFIVGALTAALAHAVFVLQIALGFAGVPVLFGGSGMFATLQMIVVVAGYGASMMLGAVSAQRRGDHGVGPLLVFTFPVYWLLMAAAVLLAAHDLATRPHHWHKTRHGLAERPGASASRKTGGFGSGRAACD